MRLSFWHFRFTTTKLIKMRFDFTDNNKLIVLIIVLTVNKLPVEFCKSVRSVRVLIVCLFLTARVVRYVRHQEEKDKYN